MKALRTTWLLLGVLGCAGSEPDPATPRDAGVDRDAGVAIDGGIEVDAGVERDAGELRDGGRARDGGTTRDGGAHEGRDFATAINIPIGGPTVAGVIDPAMDVDYYRIEASAGVFLRIEAVPSHFSMPTDPVLQVFDASMTLVAENDDSPQAIFGIDSEIVYRTPAAGTYFITVQDWRGWSPASPMAEGGPDFLYTLDVAILDANNPREFPVDETGDDLADATSLGSGPSGFLVAGVFDHPGDVDIFRVTLGPPNGTLQARMWPSGAMTGHGSTTPASAFTITSTDGATIFGRSTVASGFFMRVPALPGDYLLRVEHPGTALGANDFYVLDGYGDNNPPPDPEPGALNNGTAARAAGLTPAGVFRTANIAGSLPDGDVDYFAFDVAMNDQPSVSCFAEFVGSGVRGLEAQLLTANETEVARVTEMIPGGAQIPPQQVPTPARYLLRLSKGGQDTLNPTTFYQCRIQTRS